ncbi:HNH endonuclease [Elizabethkingia anophelis]|uniref:HNH domain-containing protein n=1 Tax=Elizabethkingia anophelis TaxID=1117645 RepID=A0A7Z7M1S1_9FLAO|nr:HNH endonuclease [Elizabethkingia anophelis]MCT3845067.1 HNH endonuclease [Elizabethkingia anophelis]STF08888.1 Uncharacterised protein [Elizabethkingia anophelis]
MQNYYSTEFHDIRICNNCQFQTIQRFDDCCENPDQIIVNDASFFPNFRLYKQCRNCGGAKRNFPLKYTDDIEVRGEFDLEYFERWRNKVSFDKKIVYESVSHSNYLSSPLGKYHRYLESPEWKAKRKIVFERDENICQECKKKPAFHVHHLTYQNIFNEKLEDLISVCTQCHSMIHYQELMKKIEDLKNKK